MTATRPRRGLRLPRMPAVSLPGRSTGRQPRTQRKATTNGRLLKPRLHVGGSDAPMRVFSVGPRRHLAAAAGAPAAVLRRLGPARVVVLLVLALALGGAWLWFRDSSVVAIKRVTVTGLSGTSAGRIRAALMSAARGMSTLDIQTSRLHTAVQPFPEVRALHVSTQFPHGLRIRVIEQLPAAVVSAAGRRLAVSADGTVLRQLMPPRALPVIAVRALPVGPRVTDRRAQQELAVLAAAPGRLRIHVIGVIKNAAHGIALRLRRGPNLYFGTPTQLRAKWIAVTAVLANRGAAGATYIDVTDPQRPAAG